ncbi:hypothetical protein EDC04DRAFT_1022159 [Pisolithus marmoratus]|nr:hypothetical protein EDC04DRAFT_1022159 [Pisolithus marmoratus]
MWLPAQRNASFSNCDPKVSILYYSSEIYVSMADQTHLTPQKLLTIAACSCTTPVLVVRCIISYPHIDEHGQYVGAGLAALVADSVVHASSSTYWKLSAFPKNQSTCNPSSSPSGTQQGFARSSPHVTLRGSHADSIYLPPHAHVLHGRYR